MQMCIRLDYIEYKKIDFAKFAAGAVLANGRAVRVQNNSYGKKL